MKTILNKTHRPLQLHLHGGKVLHLGPSKTGQVADDATDLPAIQRLLEAGEIEVVGGAAHGELAEDDHGAPREARKGHHPMTVVHPSGNRGG